MALTQKDVLRISRNYDMSTVFRLNVKGRNISDCSVLAQCPSLKELCLDNNSITNLECLTKMPELEVLTAVNNQITTLPPLTGTSIQTLVLSNNPVPFDAVLVAVSGMETLRTLYMGYTPDLTDDEEQALMYACPSLLSINGKRVKVVRRDALSREVIEAYTVPEPPERLSPIPVDSLFPTVPWVDEAAWTPPQWGAGVAEDEVLGEEVAGLEKDVGELLDLAGVK
ncbi:hypothetical protein J8273_5664 [Carpediemonas membranifera]|uniref:Leucine rich repeat (LRR) protein n=1 Tax=Carpediemonas membranifera TaxID=201153 RepID=A0A8J6B4Q1_9EUKA|nr:hypothetical protein J8273_5664 [Carpediemonas membranifera]|eukprot:KAG9392954.1 hypothetical protein J8273_5664 [Carpediemonas membranifera]